MLEHIRRTEKETRKLRLLALVAAAAALYYRPQDFPLMPVFALILGYFFYTWILTGFILDRIRSDRIIYVMILVDALALGCGLYLAGLTNPIFILLPLLIIYYSIFFGYSSSLVAATVFSLTYISVGVFTGEARELGSEMAAQVSFLYILSFLGGYLSKRRLEERLEKEELQELVRAESHARELLEMMGRLQAAWDRDTALTRLLEHSVAFFRSLLGLPYCIIALFENGKLVAKKSNLKLSREYLEDAFSKRIEREGGVRLESRYLPLWARESYIRTLVGIPLRVGGNMIGIIYACDTSPHPYPEEEKLELAWRYGELVGQALIASQLRDMERLRQAVSELEGAVLRIDRYREPKARREITVGELRLNSTTEEAYLGERKLNLTPTEFQLLYFLAQNAGHPVNEETLLRRIWGRDHTQVNLVDVTVHRIRKKLGKEGAKLLLTVRGRGYMLTGG